MAPTSWSLTEVELGVADYFAMLADELARRPYSKTAHRERLRPLLAGRSDGSIEFKHANISAVLINYGQPYIDGYKPRFNYQSLLERVVLERLSLEPDLFDRARRSPLVIQRIGPCSRPATWQSSLLRRQSRRRLALSGRLRTSASGM